ncbi:MAG: family 43 glycosylhydrolase [Bacteroidaceae bacterium]|nr:family 43 glycosylhydrolase [Bacteroidaceae bacterium]MBQ8009269.1 family 43 glycosylhydrolase [Bacteroidaceae bacterium]
MKRIVLLFAVLVICFCSCQRTIDRSKVVTNPIDLDYEFTKGDGQQSSIDMDVDFNDPNLLNSIPEEYKDVVAQLLKVPGALQAMIERIASPSNYREAADPVVTLYNDRYYLFVSKSDGYWSSDDMQHWRHIHSAQLPVDLYAPTSMVYNGELYWMTSDINQLWKTTDPEDGNGWELVTDKLTPYPDEPDRTGHDPDLFLDDDGRVYLYWGCSNVDNIMGIELDPKNNFKAIGQPVTLITHQEKVIGWERPSDKNDNEAPGYNEGPSMLKYNGRYYLQYASPGTEFDSYGDGLYISDSPLGSYQKADYLPISVKPGGWMTGAGHGDTFQDKYGNYWHVASTVISQRHMFERRIGFFPVVFTKKGNMYTLTDFSDRPYELPKGKVDFLKHPVWTEWMDLSIGKAVTASSEIRDKEAAKAADRTIKTWWSAETGKPEEWLQMDLGKVYPVEAVQVNFADEAFPVRTNGNPFVPYKYKVEGSLDGVEWKILANRSANDVTNPHTLITLDAPMSARYIKVTNLCELPGKFSMYDLRVFGLDDGEKPSSVKEINVQRTSDRRSATISWQPIEGAQGYFVHWGTERDELYSACEVLEPSVTLGLFSADVDYYFRVDSFNESGVTKGKKVVKQ